MRTNKLLLSAFCCTLLLLIVGCSTTARIPEGEQLYVGLEGVKYEGEKPAETDICEAISEAVAASPNNYISTLNWRYPFPLGLWVYNNWSNPPSGFKHWLFEKLVEEPVLVSDVRPQVRTGMVENILADNGYFRGIAKYELLTQRNKRKAKILYTIYPGPAFHIDSIQYLPDTCAINHFIDSVAQKDSYLHTGVRFCTDSLSMARNRIANALRNRGYYFFRPDYIEYLADSLITRGSIALRLDLAEDLPRWATQRYKTGDITVTVNRFQGDQTPDTIVMSQGLTLIQMQPSRLRQQLIPENVTFRKGKIFSVRDMDRTQTYLSRLGIFKAINITALPDTSYVDPTLRVRIDCTFDAPLEASIEVNASSKSNSYIGPGITLGLTNRNIFGGGEQLSVQLTGAYEWQTGRGSGSVFNSYEAGISTSLAFPRLLAPKFIPRSRRQLNWTRFTLNADLLNRPHYFKMAQFNASVNYEWRWRRHVSNVFTPLKLTYTKLINTTADFDSIMAVNPAVALSFKSQFIPQMIYTYTYDRAIDKNNNINVQISVQEAGNILKGIYKLSGSEGEGKLFGTPFSQFVKGQAQIVWNHRLFGEHRLVYRLCVGAEHAYGNSAQVPYSEQFYCGGANSVRAFTVRSIGPGRYRSPSGSVDEYFDQTGTFKFEANIEYRFPISGALQGAFFLDTGNVWLLKDDPERPGGKLSGSDFLRDLATGTGIGLRFDIGMIVLRGDLGIGIHAPYDTGKSGYYNMESFGKSLAFHLAIGYPF